MTFVDGTGEDRLFDVEQIPLDERPVRPRPGGFKSAIDEARSFGAWTLDKLEVLRLYLKMYRRVAGGGTYIDAFAGDGRVKVGTEIHLGSALLALDSGAFHSLHLFERPRMTKRLDANLAAHRYRERCQLHPGDSNIELPALLARGDVPVAKPCFAFLDPNSTQLAWSTIEALARHKRLDPDRGHCKIELWVLFNLEQAIRRLWPTDKTHDPPYGAVLDRVMGGQAVWRDLWDAGRSADRLVYRYCERLSDLGYAFVLPQRIIDPATSRPQYWMIHATDHRAAESFMRWAKRSATATVAMTEIPGVDWPDALGTPGRR